MRGGKLRSIGNVIPAMGRAGVSSRCGAGTEFQSYLIPPCAMSVSSRPTPSRAGGPVDSRQKRNGIRRKSGTPARKPPRERQIASGNGKWCGYRATIWRLLGMDGEPLYSLSGIQTPSWRFGRIQRQIHVGSDDFAGRVVRHTSGSRACELSQLFPTSGPLAVHRNTCGNLKVVGSHDDTCRRIVPRRRPRPIPVSVGHPSHICQ
jgi:hypothetical protein